MFVVLLCMSDNTIFTVKFVTLVHYYDVIMDPMASQIVSLAIIYSTVYSGADQRKKSKLRVTGLCEGNSPDTGEFPAQMTSNAENVSIWWRNHSSQVCRFVCIMAITPVHYHKRK